MFDVVSFYALKFLQGELCESATEIVINYKLTYQMLSKAKQLRSCKFHTK
jgi:hypothetical protein